MPAATSARGIDVLSKDISPTCTAERKALASFDTGEDGHGPWRTVTIGRE